MKKVSRKLVCFICCICACILCVACGQMKDKYAEKITLAKTTFSEVEFENSEKVKLEQTNNEIKITGEIEAMSKAQKAVYGVDSVTHVVIVKIEFDNERTIDRFKIQGDVTKVYSTNKNDKNYVGSISSLLDNESGDDAFCYLILSANTKNYSIEAEYTDGNKSNFSLKIEANLVTAKSE